MATAPGDACTLVRVFGGRVSDKTSAALLAYRIDSAGVVRVFLGHMGGPFWAGRDEGGWSIPKGEYTVGDEVPVDVARREFTEEIGVPPPEGDLIDLGVFVQPSGKRITAFAVPAEASLAFVASNEFELEWPRGSGRIRSFPEIDRAEWFSLEDARRKVVGGQVPILDSLALALGVEPTG
jgi:predicted NUDIX family NTP pyrophosphohydrolase